MGVVGIIDVILNLHWHQPDSVALSLCIGCARRFLFGSGLGYFFALARKKIDVKENGVAVGYLTCSKIFSCSFARLAS